MGAYSIEQIITVFLYLVPAILIVTGRVLFGRHLCRALGWDPFHRHSRQQRLVFIFQALYSRMHRLGLPQKADSQSEEFLAFCEKELSCRCPETVSLLRPTVEKLYQICFGGEKASQRDISAMRRILLASFHSKT